MVVNNAQLQEKTTKNPKELHPQWQALRICIV